MSKAGQTYRGANVSAIANYGQSEVTFWTSDGQKGRMRFQVADVERPLLSVARLRAAGNEVVFGLQQSYIRHVSSGKSVPLVREGNIYLLDMYFPDQREEEDRDRGGVDQGLPRQEKPSSPPWTLSARALPAPCRSP